MAEKQFKLKISNRSTDTCLDFTVLYANEGSDTWIVIASYPSRIEAEAFIDGYTKF